MICDFLKKYNHTIEELPDCFFYKIKIETYRINIQEDKMENDHFVSIRDGEKVICMRTFDNIQDVCNCVKSFIL